MTQFRQVKSPQPASAPAPAAALAKGAAAAGRRGPVLFLPPGTAEQRRRYMRAAAAARQGLEEWAVAALDTASGAKRACTECAALRERLKSAEARVARLEADSGTYSP